MSEWLSPLRRAERLLGARLIELEEQLPASWDQYLRALDSYLLILERTSPQKLMTTKELAARFKVTSKTVQRRLKAGVIQPAAVVGSRPRWNGNEMS